jgi:hypothetical protein
LSSDTSPKSGYRLEQPNPRAGATGAPIRRPDRRPESATPSWAAVIGTTLRLWVRRRVLRVPDTGRIRGTRRATAAVAVVVVVAAAIAAVILLAVPHAAQHKSTARRLTPAQERARATAAREAAANAQAAARWIAAEVSPQAVIGCDPVTCSAMVQSGYTTAGQVVLQRGVRLPAAAGALIVDTPALRAQYGVQVAAAAPAVIASFGAGSQAVHIRLVVPGGAASYSQAVASALAARQTAGRQLIASQRVHPRPVARADLAAGLVDPRLLMAFAKLAAAQFPVFIVYFADSGPQASGLAPYRQAEIGGLTNVHVRGQLSQLAAAEKLLASLPSGDQPTIQSVSLPEGRFGIWLQFPAPSPT